MLRPMLWTICCCCALAAASARAAVIVVANRTAAAIEFRLTSRAAADPQAAEFRLDAGDVVPIPAREPAQLTFEAAGQPKQYRVVPYGVYYFGEARKGQIDLGQIGLGLSNGHAFDAATAADARAGDVPPPASPKSIVIPVKILFDDAEMASRAEWEKRLRSRFDEVSQIFKRHCFVEFEIVAIESWHSDDAKVGLEESLVDFERAVDPAPARLAIGFTGQFKLGQKYPHLGGTRGPLHSHMLIRELARKISEPERLEVLVHELGHFLGAAHSPERNSVMRVLLGDRQARLIKFRIGFDPINTMAMCLVNEELAAQPKLRFSQMHPTTKAELRKIYAELARALPNDPTPEHYLHRLDPTAVVLPTPARP